MNKITRKSFIQRLTALAGGFGLLGKVVADSEPFDPDVVIGEPDKDWGDKNPKYVQGVISWDGKEWTYSEGKAPMEFERVNGQIVRVSEWSNTPPVDTEGPFRIGKIQNKRSE